MGGGKSASGGLGRKACRVSACKQFRGFLLDFGHEVWSLRRLRDQHFKVLSALGGGLNDSQSIPNLVPKHSACDKKANEHSPRLGSATKRPKAKPHSYSKTQAGILKPSC